MSCKSEVVIENTYGKQSGSITLEVRWDFDSCACSLKSPPQFLPSGPGLPLTPPDLMLREAMPLVANFFAAAGQTEVCRHQRSREWNLGFSHISLLSFVPDLRPMGQEASQDVLRVTRALWLCVPCRLRSPTMHLF